MHPHAPLSARLLAILLPLLVACDSSPSEPNGGNDLAITLTGMYLVQAVQTMEGSVPLVAGRDAYLRVFGRANIQNQSAPGLTVRIYNGTTLQSTLAVPLQEGFVPTAVSQGTMQGNWNVAVPGSLIQSGLRVEAELASDPSVRFPATGGPLQVTVRVVPPLRIRFVPVFQAYNGLTGDIREANKELYLELTRKIFPVLEVDADIRPPYALGGGPFDPEGSTWHAIVSELDAVRIAEGSGRYYYGVIRTDYPGGGVVGIAAGIPSRTSLGWDRFPDAGLTVAHELGHNFGRRHAPCGGAGGPDPNYPYSAGVIGVHGMDVTTGEIKTPSGFSDVMGYCTNAWVSDYTFTSVMNYRGQADAQMGLAGAEQPTLLVWGRISDDELVLEPAFHLVTRPVLPAAPGPYRIEGFDADGVRLFSYAFAGAPVEHLSGNRQIFSFALPLAERLADRLSELKLVGPGGRNAVRRIPAGPTRLSAGMATRGAATVVAEGAGRMRVRWNSEDAPMVMVRAAATGEILSLARGGDAVVPAAVGGVEVIVSDGVRSGIGGPRRGVR